MRGLISKIVGWKNNETEGVQIRFKTIHFRWKYLKFRFAQFKWVQKFRLLGLKHIIRLKQINCNAASKRIATK